MNLPYKLTLDVSAESEEVMTREFVKYLRERGWHCAPPHGKWEPLGVFIKRVHLSGHDAFHRRLKEWTDRGNLIPLQRRDGSNRIREILTNPEFDTYCLLT